MQDLWCSTFQSLHHFLLVLLKEDNKLIPLGVVLEIEYDWLHLSFVFIITTLFLSQDHQGAFDLQKSILMNDMSPELTLRCYKSLLNGITNCHQQIFEVSVMFLL